MVVGHFAASLPRDIRVAALPAILDALPSAADDVHFVRARLLLAADLPEDDVRKLNERLLDLEKDPQQRAEGLTLVLGIPHESRAKFERSFFLELERIPSASRRGDLLVKALEHVTATSAARH